jgi:CRP/FNR family transcriptional regulator, cyclic AMP receptor protein
VWNAPPCMPGAGAPRVRPTQAAFAANDADWAAPAPHELAQVQQGRWFRALSTPAQDALLAHGTQLRVPAGRVVQGTGLARGDWFAVVRGSVRLAGVFANGRAFTLSFLKPGEWFGQFTTPGGSAELVEPVAQTDCMLLVVRGSSIKRLASQHPEILLGLLELSYARLAEMTQLVEELQTLPLPQRLARKMVWMLRREPGPPRLCLSQQEWADLLVASRQRVNVALRAMERAGIISLGSRSLQVLSLPGLSELAQRGELRSPKAAA